jgi:Na+-driven multidrug efflux pump
MIVAFAFQGLGRATVPLLVMIVRVAAVLIAAILCTSVLGLGERAVFTCIAVGNVAGAIVLIGLFAKTNRAR